MIADPGWKSDTLWWTQSEDMKQSKGSRPVVVLEASWVETGSDDEAD
jgi:hypothetical protein